MVDVSGIAGTTMGIAGMGIGITLLAKTAKDISDINSRTMRGTSTRRSSKPRRRSYRTRRPSIRMRTTHYKPKLMKF